jgi:hypothetical protein
VFLFCLAGRSVFVGWLREKRDRMKTAGMATEVIIGLKMVRLTDTFLVLRDGF